MCVRVCVGALERSWRAIAVPAFPAAAKYFLKSAFACFAGSAPFPSKTIACLDRIANRVRERFPPPGR